MPRKIPRFIFSPPQEETRRKIPQKIPVGAAKNRPEWIQDIPVNNSIRDTTIRSCIPFSDATNLGCLVLSPADIMITAQNGSHSKLTTSTSEIISTKVPSNGAARFYGNTISHQPKYILDSGWDIEIPDGYGLFVVQPINRPDVEINTGAQLLGKKDTSKQLPIQVPIDFRQSDLPIMIRAGTPLLQLVPIHMSDLAVGYDIRSCDDERKKRAFLDFAKDMSESFYSRYVHHPPPVAKINSPVESQDPTWDSNPPSEYPDSFKINGEKMTVEVFDILEDGSNYIVPADEIITDNYKRWLFETLSIINEEQLARRMISAMGAGYMQRLNDNVQISAIDQDNIRSKEQRNMNIIRSFDRKKMGGKNPFNSTAIVFIDNKYITKMPLGYSLFHSRPFNHYQTIWKSASGLASEDIFTTPTTSPGFFFGEIGKNYQFKQGSPVTQLIPIKREHLKTEFYINKSQADMFNNT